MRRAGVVIACAGVLVGVFVFMHSGARATDVCGDAGLARASPAPSFLPPGAQCIGGTDGPDIVRFDGSFLLVVPSLYLLLGFIAWAGGRAVGRRAE